MTRTLHHPWLNKFAWLTAVMTFLLLGLGGLVTSHEAGLAVPDWPTSYGYNMFLFPVHFWRANILYEHTHRLLASFVGLLTTILAVWLWLREPRRWLRWLGVTASLAVVLQGVLGGLRVTMLKDQIGIFHAALAQSFFCHGDINRSGPRGHRREACRFRSIGWRFVVPAPPNRWEHNLDLHTTNPRCIHASSTCWSRRARFSSRLRKGLARYRCGFPGKDQFGLVARGSAIDHCISDNIAHDSPSGRAVDWHLGGVRGLEGPTRARRAVVDGKACACLVRHDLHPSYFGRGNGLEQ